jgi:hypothetical protein
MAGLRNQKVETNLFQNIKMFDTVHKWTLQAENLKMNIIEDIQKKVFKLKRTANELEVIATKLKKIMDIGSETESTQLIKKKTAKAKNRDPVKCDVCDTKFNTISDLERHIKETHEDYQVYECYECSKIFVTEWRLNKHRRIHSDEKTRQCIYFRKKIRCPYDEFGCKFRHSTDIQDTTSGQMIEYSTKLSEHSIDIQTISRQGEDMVEVNSFYTSTPKKQENHRSAKKDWFKCEYCINSSMLMNKSQCIDCYVDEHMHNLHKKKMTHPEI